jgi:23S rRNA pseudouridine1911/1915/1917 synthase
VFIFDATPQPGCYYHNWPVLYQDNHLLALYKPAGLLVQGDATEDVSLLELGKAWLKEKYQKPGRVFLGLVHRLDRPVAGVVVFARTSKAAARLSEQFRSGTVEKRYLAVVEGTLSEAAGRWIDQLGREDRNSRVVPELQTKTQEARLRYRVLASHGDTSLVEIDLETGRRHQIRVQFAHRGHPLLGDQRYGTSTIFPNKQIALLAKSIAFNHPVRDERLTVESPMPRGWPWPGTATDPAGPPWSWDESP